MDCSAAGQLAQKLSQDVMVAQQFQQRNDLFQNPQNVDPLVNGNIFSAPSFDQVASDMNEIFTAPQSISDQRHAAALEMTRQQQEMAKAFNTQNIPQQDHLNIRNEVATGANISSMMAMASVHSMMGSVPRTSFQPTLNVAFERQELLSSPLQATGTKEVLDTKWIDQLAEQNWNQNFEDVQNYIPPGEDIKTTEQKTEESEFYSFLDCISEKRILIDEINGTLIEGPGPDPELEEDTQKLKEWAAEEGIHFPAGACEGADESFSRKTRTDAFTAKRFLFPEAYSRNVTRDMGREAMDLMPEDGYDEWIQDYAASHQTYNEAANRTDYPFEENNPYMYSDNPLQEGKEMLGLSNLSDAALAFEAVCKKDNNNKEAWLLLGNTQGDNEKDRLALIALNNARRVDPTDIGVHAALCVTHVNLFNAAEALESLKAWLSHHPEYSYITKMSFEALTSEDRVNEQMWLDPVLVNEVTTLYNVAVEMHPNDPALHSNLGVVYNVLHDFDAAAKEYRAAAELRPQDPVLWNRLGASLANASKAKEAQEAYRIALDLNPGYVRCYYNLGVAFSNSGNTEEAVKTLIRALGVQRGLTEPTRVGMCESQPLWEMLRMCLSQMGRHDLVELSYKESIEELKKAL